MIKPCIRCKNQRGDSELKNIRGDVNLEGKIIANFPEVLEIDENIPIEVCVNCLRELNEQNNASKSIRNKTINRSNNQTVITNSEDISVESESIQSLGRAPLTSSGVGNISLPRSLDIEKLKEPGAVEKLIPNNPNIQRNVRQLLAKSMPIAAKKRKLHEMLETLPNITIENAGQRSSSNSPSETIIERAPTQPGGRYAEDLLKIITNRSLIANRSYRSDSSRSSNSSRSIVPVDVTPPVIENVSSQAIVIPSQEVTLPPPSPVIRNRTQPTLTVLYEPDSSSDGNRSRNTSSSSENEPKRRSSGRAASRNSSVASDNGQPAPRNTDKQGTRRTDDGNDHSNLAAPRRVNVELPKTTRPQTTLKDMSGG